MNSLRDPGNPLDVLVLASPQQRGLRLLALVAALVFLVLVPVSGGDLHPVLTGVGVLVAVLVALVPGSNAGLGLLVYLGALWAFATPGSLGLWTLGAAVDLVVLHLACTLASYGPPGLTLDPRLLRLWVRRAGLCATAALPVWLVARLVSSLDRPPSAVALGVALLLVLAWATVMTLRLAQPPADVS